MANSSFICRGCYNEYGIQAVYQESQKDADGGLQCPDCGSESFGI